eukprot:8750976-Prorocentrum_lima.AAC.1
MTKCTLPTLGAIIAWVYKRGCPAVIRHKSQHIPFRCDDPEVTTCWFLASEVGDDRGSTRIL